MCQVDFDRTKHLAESTIKQRAQEREKLIRQEREREEAEKKKKELEELKREQERWEIWFNINFIFSKVAPGEPECWVTYLTDTGISCI